MTSTGVVQSMKDFYWDIRPKPEFGTIELRVCDTPLTVEKAAALACYLQCLCRYLREERPFEPAEDDYLVYTFNRFQACRFGLDGEIVDPKTKQRQQAARRHPAHARARRRACAGPAGAGRQQPDPRDRCSTATTRAGCARCARAARRCRPWWKPPAHAG